MTLIGSFKSLFFNIKSFLIVALLALFYFSFSVLILNYRLVLVTLFNENPIVYKLTVIYQLITGSYSAFYILDFYALILISLLVGMNILVTFKILKNLRNEQGKLSIVFGGSAVLGILAVGCSSCGFSVLSLLGLASALSIIPLGKFGLTFIVILFLLISLFYSVKTYHNKIFCRVKPK